MSTASNDGEFQMSNEELDNFQKAMKSEEFRKLLVEYAQEISDPENKKKYEEEIAQMERERGMDVTFVHPEGGFVMKTTRLNDGMKAFVNICYNQHINDASFQDTEKEENGLRKKGQQWSIPFSLSQARDDLDNAGKKCVVFDVVFNPETYKKGQQDQRFRETIITTALDGIEKQLNVKLNRKNLKFPKIKFKGMKQATVIRKKTAEQPDNKANNTIGGQSFPYPYPKYPTSPKTNTKKNKKTNVKETNSSDGTEITSNENKQVLDVCNNSTKHCTEPVYHIVHRGVIDFQNFTNARDSCTSTRPKELIVSIELPLLKSTGSVELDIFEKKLVLNHQDPVYHLDLTLPFPVDEANGHAKFDKSKCELVVTLPVIQPETPDLPHTGITEHEDKPCNEVEQENRLSNHKPVDLDGSSKNVEESINPCDPVTNEREASEKTAKEQSSKELENIVDGNIVEAACASNDIEVNGTGVLNGSGVLNRMDEENAKSQETKVTNDLTAMSPLATDTSPSDELHPDVVISDEIVDVPEMAWDNGDINIDRSSITDVRFDLPPTLSEISSPFFFKSPPYSFHQDTDTVTLVVRVPNVAMENVSLGFNENKCYINFPCAHTKPHALLEADYALYVAFTDGHNLATDLCHIDVNEDNLVLTLTKDEACKGLWDSFQAGPGEERLEEKFFVTDNNVEVMMQEIAEQDPWAGQSKYKPDLKVSSVSDEHLTIQLDNKLAEALKENERTTRNHVLGNHQQHHIKSSSEESSMDSKLLENHDLKEGILSSKVQHMKLSSPDEGIEHDFYRNERREKYSYGLSERIAASTDPKLVQDHGHKTSGDERRKPRSDSVDSISSERSDSSTSDLGAVRTRKSCIRRNSSTSTDDDEFDFNGSLSPSGSWGSPGKRNVRFNLNPKVRVFSNKKDKQRWKMEQRLKTQKMSPSQCENEKSSSGEEKPVTLEAKERRFQAASIAEEGHPVDITLENGRNTGVDNGKRKDSESSVDEEWTMVDKPTLSNALIFELDE